MLFIFFQLQTMTWHNNNDNSGSNHINIVATVNAIRTGQQIGTANGLSVNFRFKRPVKSVCRAHLCWTALCRFIGYNFHGLLHGKAGSSGRSTTLNMIIAIIITTTTIIIGRVTPDKWQRDKAGQLIGHTANNISNYHCVSVNNRNSRSVNTAAVIRQGGAVDRLRLSRSSLFMSQAVSHHKQFAVKSASPKFLTIHGKVGLVVSK